MPGNDTPKIQSGLPTEIAQPICLIPEKGKDKQTGQEAVDQARDSYLDLFGQKLSQGTIVLNKPEKNQAVSEGVGFAGLLFADSNSQQSQDSFWQVYKGRKAYFLKPNGVMAWKVNNKGKKTGKVSASDADQDWIAAEIMAYKKLKSGEWTLPTGMTLATFEAEIKKDLKAFWDVHVKQKNGRHFLLATDGSWAKRGDGREVYYPSYPDPHFLRMFADFDTKHDWKKLADDVQELNLAMIEILKQDPKALGAVGQNPMPAKAFVIIKADGSYKIEEYYKKAKAEGQTGKDVKDNVYDSIRFVALRMTRAAILDKDQDAIKILQELLKIAKVNKPSDANIDGYNNTLARASYGLALLASGGNADVFVDDFYCSIMKDHQGKVFFESAAVGQTDYYGQSLILQSLDLVLKKQTWKGVKITEPEKVEVSKEKYPESALPKGFPKQEAEAKAFAMLKKVEANAAQGRINMSNEEIDHQQAACEASKGTNYACDIIGKENIKLFKEYTTKFIFLRDIGDPATAKALNDALKYKGSATAYERHKLASILLSGKPGQAEINALRTLGAHKTKPELRFAQNLPAGATKLSRSEKYKVYQEILASYQSSASANGKKKNGLQTSPLLEGKIMLQMAILAKLLGEAVDSQKHFDDAIDKFEIFTEGKDKAAIAKLVAKIAKNDDKAATRFNGEAHLLKAQALMLQAGDIPKPSDELAQLEAAYELLKLAAPQLEGFFRLQIKLLAAESLIRQAFILKDQGKPQPEYQVKFDAARSLLHDILRWKGAYDNVVTKDQPFWANQIEAYSKLWLAKLIMVEAGEERPGKPKLLIAEQKKQLVKAWGELAEILKMTAYLESEAVADVKKTLGENLARQAFILMDRGDKKYNDYFDTAEKYLAAAAKHGDKLTQAEAHSWLAQIAVVRAGKSKNKDELLAAAREHIDKALDVGKLKGNSLSAAYKISGDIYVGEKDFSAAKKAFGQALDFFARNYAARVALADVHSWSRNYVGEDKADGAIEHYDTVIDAAQAEAENGSPVNTSILLQAELGKIEATMRQSKVYLEIEEHLSLFATIFNGQPVSSYLITRAISLIQEAYIAEKAYQDQVIHVANTLLGTDYDTDKKAGALAKLISQQVASGNISASALDDKFMAGLYLKLASVLSWDKGKRYFDEAMQVLKTGKAKYQETIMADQLLDIRYSLTEATIKLRAEEKSQPQIYQIVRKIFKTASDETDLIEEALKVLVEEFLVEERFDKVILLADYMLDKDLYTASQSEDELGKTFQKKHISDLALTFSEVEATLYGRTPEEIEKAFTDRDLGKAYSEIKFDFLLNLIDALTWSKKFGKALEVAQEALDGAEDQKLSVLKKASLYVRVGEIFRYGIKDDKKAKEKAGKYYTQARDIIEAIPAKKRSTDHNAVLAKAYYGLGMIEPDRGASLAYLQRAEELAEQSAEVDLEKEIEGVLAFKEDPFLTVQNTTFIDHSDRVENRFQVKFALPFENFTSVAGLPTPQAAYQLDSADGARNHSLYLGSKWRFLELFDADSRYLDLEGMFKVAEDYKSTDGADIKFFRPADMILSAVYGNKAFSLVGAAEIFTGESEYNSYYASFMGNVSPYVQLGAEYNHYLFTYTGDQKTRDEFNLALRGNVDLAELGLEQYNQAKLRFYIGYPYFQYGEDIFPNGVSGADFAGNFFTNFKLGLGMDIHLGKGVVLGADISFQHQQNYNYGTGSVTLRF